MSLTEDITKFVAEANLLFETESEQFPRLFEFIWTGVAAIFLFFMQIGYIMLASGGSQRSNMQNTVYHILIAYGLTTFWWWVLGYGFAHGDSRGGNAFIGTKEFVLADGFFLFHKFIVHLGYCLVAVVVAVAGLFERSTTLAYVALASVMSFLVVPVVMHWLWSTNGWLSTRNPANAIVYVLDFGGSGVAHTVGGMAALVASIVVGPRRNAAKALRHKQATLDGAVSPSTPRDVPSVPQYTAAVLFGDSTLHFVGGLALWLGSYGLCQARVGTQEQSRALAGLIGVNTSLAASFAGITAAIYAHFRAPERKTRYVVNGFISGLGAIAAGAPFIQPYGAMAIGVLSAVVFILATALLDRLNIDDTMDSISAHLFPGAFGLIAAAVASDVNLLAQFFPTLTQSKGVYVGSALLAIVCIVVWVGFIVGGILLLLQAAGWLQLSDVEQERGLDPIADPLRERVRINTHLLETSNVQGLTTSERACTNCGMWMTGDCVRGCTNDYYHRACFQCAVCSKPLLKSFVNVLNEPLCVACASSGRVGPAALSPGVKSSQKPRAAADAVVNASPRDDDNVEADDADADGEYTYSYQYEEISGDEGQDNAKQQGTEMKPVETELAANVSETESYETDSDEEVEAEEEEETETETEASTDSDETK